MEDDYEAKWVKPCRCRGTTKWVHQTCLQRWVDEKQKGNSSAEVCCPQCGTRYIIVFPEFGKASPSSQFTNTAESLRLYCILPNSSNNQNISVNVTRCFVGPILKVVDSVDKMIQHACPFGMGLLFCGGVYWTAFTYGFIVVLQVRKSLAGTLFTCLLIFMSNMIHIKAI